MMVTMMAMTVHFGWTMNTAYVDSNLVGTGKISRAAIIGLQGGVWAASPGYNVRLLIPTFSSLCKDIDIAFFYILKLTAEEQQAAIKAFANPDETQGHGVRLAGQKFFTLQATDEHVYGKKGVRLTPPAPASFLLSVFDAFYFPAHRDATSLNDF